MRDLQLRVALTLPCRSNIWPHTVSSPQGQPGMECDGEPWVSPTKASENHHLDYFYS